MNNKFIKYISMILVTIIMISIAPVNEIVVSEVKNSANGIVKSIGAVVETFDFSLPEITVKAKAINYCSFYWSEINKTLTVTGSGKMPDYNKTTSPWNDCKDARHLVITGDFTSVGQNAFENFTMLEDVVIEAPVTYINAYAFQGCSSLKNVTLPDTLKQIMGAVFKDCISLKEIVIPDSVTAVYRSFPGCNLEKITTPFIGGGPGNTSETKSDQLGYMFGTIEYENTYAVKSKADKKVNYYIPYSLKSVTVTKDLNKYNFQNAVGVEEIIIEDTVTTEYIPACFAQDCDNLSKFTIKSSKIKTIGMYAFADCVNLNSIVLPDCLESVKAYAFENCSALTDITFPEKDFAVEYASFKNAQFVVDSQEEFLTIGDGVLIEYKGTDENVVVPDGVKRIGSAFYNKVNIREVILPDSLLYLSKGSFYGCTLIEKLVVPDSVQIIDAGALSGLCNLKELSIPFTGNSRDAADETIKPLFGYIFGTDSKCPVCSNQKCTADTQYYTKKNNGKDIQYSYVYNYPKSLYTVTVTDNPIPCHAFRSSNVKKVVLGDGVTEIAPYSFYSSSLREIVFNEVISTLPGLAFSKCSNLKSVTLTSSIKSINGAFENCTGLTTVNFVEGLESIDKGFLGCTYLSEFTLPDSLKTIKNKAFGNCKSIKEMHFGKGLQQISANAFIDDRDDYRSIEAFYVDEENPYLFSSDGVIYSRDGVLIAYPENKNESSFYINENVTNIYIDTLDQMDITREFIVHPDNQRYTAIDGVLYNKDVTMLIRCPREKTGDYISPETVVEVNYLAFYRCTSLNKIEFVNKNVEFEEAAFQGVDVDEFIVPNLDESISYYFRNQDYKGDLGWAEIKKLKITNQKNSLEDHFAKYVSGLESVEIEGSYWGIGDYAFSGCSFEEFTIPETVTWIGEGAFNQAGIKRIYGGNNIRKIGRSAFANSDLEYFEMPEALETLESFAFAGVYLTEVEFHDKLVEVGYQVFNYSKIKRAVINEAIKHLSDELFVNCFDLETVIIGGAVESIGEEVFGGCTALETVVIPSNVVEISDNAFLEANEELVIYCNAGSYAEEYAISNRIKYTTLVIDPIENQTYTGREITPEVNASANNRRLTLDAEYTVSYKNNINAGSATVIAKGLGDFKHLAATAQFTILPKTAETVRVLGGHSTYDPNGIKPEFYVLCGSEILVEGVDYQLIDNETLTDAGEYNVAISLIGNYDGVINTTYKISKKSITETEIKYGKNVKVTDKGKVLEEGKDYVITREINGKGETITSVEGIGNYTGRVSNNSEDNEESIGIFEQILNLIRNILMSFTKIFG